MLLSWYGGAVPCLRSARSITVDELRESLCKEGTLLEEEIGAILEEVDTDKVRHPTCASPAHLPRA